MPKGLKYLPRGFYKLIAYKSTSVVYYAFTISKPIFPAYANEVINIIKEGD